MGKTARWRWVLGLTLLPLVGLLLFFCVALMFLHRIVTPERVRVELMTALTEALGADVQIDEVRYEVLSGIEVLGLKVGPPAAAFSEDLLRARRIALRYDLSEVLSKKITVTEIALEAPRLTLETRGGVSNVALLASRLGGGEPGPSPSVPPDRSKPWSPIRLSLETLHVDDVQVEMTGEGPTLKVAGVSLELNLAVSPADVMARLRLVLDPNGAPNVVLHGASSTDGVEVDAAMQLALTSTLTLAGRTDLGLTLERIGARVDLRASGDVRRGGVEIPRPSLAVALDAALLPSENQFQLSSATVDFAAVRVLDAAFGVDGISRVISALAGDGLVEELGLAIGLADKKGGSGVSRLSVARLHLPLGELAPYALLIGPGLNAAGSITIGPFEVVGTVPELLAGVPRSLRGELALSGISIKATSLLASVRGLDGRVTVTRDGVAAPSVGPTFQVEGEIALAEPSLGPWSVRALDVDLRLKAGRLAFPVPGAFDGELSIDARSVEVPGTRVARARAKVEVHGEDVFHSPRAAAQEPVAISIRLDGDQIRARTGTVSREARDLLVHDIAAVLDLGVDQLLLPAQRPIKAKLSVDVSAIDGPSSDVVVEKTKLSLLANVTDPRLGRDLDADLQLTVSAAKVLHDMARVDRPNMAVTAKIRGVPSLGSFVPKTAATTIDLDLPGLAVTHPSTGRLETSLHFTTHAEFDRVSDSVLVSSVSLTLGDFFGVTAKGRCRSLRSGRPSGELEIELPEVDLAKVLAHAPKGILALVPGASASGKVSMSLHAVGSAPAPGESLDLTNPPFEVDLLAELHDVAASLPANEIELSGLGGKVGAALGKTRTRASTELSVVSLRRGALDGIEAFGLTLHLKGELIDDTWNVGSRVDVERLAPIAGNRRPLERAHAEMEAHYEKRGSFELRHLGVSAPLGGVDVSARGRLFRGPFGVLRPELDLTLALDLDRLRMLVPEIGDAHGRLDARLGVTHRAAEILDLEGAIEMNALSYKERGRFEVKNAHGRIPISQRFSLPAAEIRDASARAEGRLGDDLEARLSDLLRDLTEARAHLDSSDILVEAPRPADYEALRHYYARTGSQLAIEEVLLGKERLRAVSLEGMWRSGVLRIDRFAAQLWEGDVFGNMAAQLTADGNARVRLRGRITELNMDIPYATANDLEPVSDPDQKEDFRVTGTMDLKFALRERSVNGTFDLPKMRKPMLLRLLTALDPKGENQAITNTKQALGQAAVGGVRPAGAKIVIAENLLNLTVDWERLWLKVASTDQGIFMDILANLGKPLLIPLVGGPLMANVNSGVRRVSVSNVIDSKIPVEAAQSLARIEGHVVAAGMEAR